MQDTRFQVFLSGFMVLTHFYGPNMQIQRIFFPLWVLFSIKSKTSNLRKNFFEQRQLSGKLSFVCEGVPSEGNTPSGSGTHGLNHTEEFSIGFPNEIVYIH